MVAVRAIANEAVAVRVAIAITVVGAHVGSSTTVGAGPTSKTLTRFLCQSKLDCRRLRRAMAHKDRAACEGCIRAGGAAGLGNAREVGTAPKLVLTLANDAPVLVFGSRQILAVGLAEICSVIANLYKRVAIALQLALLGVGDAAGAPKCAQRITVAGSICRMAWKVGLCEELGARAHVIFARYVRRPRHPRSLTCTLADTIGAR